MFSLELQNAIRNEEVIYLPNFYDLNITLEDAERDAEYARSVNNIKLYDHGYCSHTAYITTNEVKRFCQILSNETGSHSCDAHFFVTYDVDCEGFGAHSDGTDILFIQCVGATVWEIDGMKYKLTENDGIYFPANTIHEVRSLTEPRVGCSFGFKALR
jgi:mannose-6-phosphate isomerase-like protein (cupin superfamily)